MQPVYEVSTEKCQENISTPEERGTDLCEHQKESPELNGGRSCGKCTEDVCGCQENRRTLPSQTPIDHRRRAQARSNEKYEDLVGTYGVQRRSKKCNESEPFCLYRRLSQLTDGLHHNGNDHWLQCVEDSVHLGQSAISHVGPGNCANHSGRGNNKGAAGYQQTGPAPHLVADENGHLGRTRPRDQIGRSETIKELFSG